MRVINFLDSNPEIQDLLNQAIDRKCSFGIHFVNSYSLVCMAIRKIPDRNFETNFYMIDGKPLQKYLKLKFKRNIFTIRGVDFLRLNIGFLAKQKINQIFLSFDSFFEISLRRFCLKNEIDCGQMKFITLNESLQFSEFPFLEDSNFSEKSVVWIFAGTPKQDEIAKSLQIRNGLVTVGVGGALDMIIGKKKEAPKYMRFMYLEWLYRLIQEPKRLWKRYAFGNIAFLILIAFDILAFHIYPKAANSQKQINLLLPDIRFPSD